MTESSVSGLGFNGVNYNNAIKNIKLYETYDVTSAFDNVLNGYVGTPVPASSAVDPGNGLPTLPLVTETPSPSADLAGVAVVPGTAQSIGVNQNGSLGFLSSSPFESFVAFKGSVQYGLAYSSPGDNNIGSISEPNFSLVKVSSDQSQSSEAQSSLRQLYELDVSQENRERFVDDAKFSQSIQSQQLAQGDENSVQVGAAREPSSVFLAQSSLTPDDARTKFRIAHEYTFTQHRQISVQAVDSKIESPFELIENNLKFTAKDSLVSAKEADADVRLNALTEYSFDPAKTFPVPGSITSNKHAFFLSDSGVLSSEVELQLKLDSQGNLAENSVEQLKNEVVWLTRSKLSQTRISLNPANLGAIEVSIDSSKDEVSIQFITQIAQTKDLITDSLTRLRDGLIESGINLKDVDVQHHEQKHNNASDSGSNTNALNQNKVDASPSAETKTAPLSIAASSASNIDLFA